jgi:hypothetical protein
LKLRLISDIPITALKKTRPGWDLWLQGLKAEHDPIGSLGQLGLMSWINDLWEHFGESLQTCSGFSFSLLPEDFLLTL